MEARDATSRPMRETTSWALQRRKTSPTNSVSVRGGFSASGKCQGESKVAVRARCCSAITRREILCGVIY